MTRETKIGLLVGLAFIIVIGILLSDHLTSTTEPPQAKLAQAGSNVRQAVSVPGAANANPPITQVGQQAPVMPQQPIPTKDDLTPKPAPVQIVAIGPSGQQQQQQSPVNVVPPAPAALVAQPANAQADGQQQQKLPIENPIIPQTPQITQTPTPAPQGDLTQVARQIGEEIVGLTGPTPTTPTQSSNNSGAATLAGGKAYKAQAGDTLSKLAGRFMGGNTKANRDAIIAANPSLQKNPDVVVAGKTYIIPVSGNSAAPALATQTPAASPITLTPSASPEYWYTVKENDTLRRIAVNQLGDEDAWAAIQELNKTTLKGDDKTVVIPGMKLKLPAKPIASAS
jgi:LysM repeat protein